MPALKREDSRDSLLALVTLVTNTGGPLALTESALRSKPFAFLSFLTPMLGGQLYCYPFYVKLLSLESQPTAPGLWADRGRQ